MLSDAENQKSRYKKMKELHRCNQCGEQDERTLAGYTFCNACVEKQKQYQRQCRQKMKEQYRCVKCGTQDERTLAGKTCCAFCSKRQKLLYREKCKEFYEKKNAITERLRKDNEDFEK